MTPPIIPPYQGKRWLDVPNYLPVDAPLKGTLPRSRGQLLAVIDQFDVATAFRYARTPTDTYCNIFSWDVTRALGCEIPHWVDDAGAIVRPGKGRELRIDGTLKWLLEHGPAHGWTETTRAGATAAAEEGLPVVAIGVEHIAVGAPAIGGFGLHVAQAGAHNFSNGSLERAWLVSDLSKLKYFLHP